MASKKKPTTRPSELLIPFLDVSEYDSQFKASELSWNQNLIMRKQENVRLKLNATGVETRDEDLFTIERLLLNQRRLLSHVAELYALLEDPAVAHAVAAKRTRDELTSKMDEFQSELNQLIRRTNGSEDW